MLTGLCWVQVREELQKCWRTEGVNHYEVCHPLTEKYLDLLRTNRVSNPRRHAPGRGLIKVLVSGRGFPQARLLFLIRFRSAFHTCRFPTVDRASEFGPCSPSGGRPP